MGAVRGAGPEGRHRAPRLWAGKRGTNRIAGPKAVRADATGPYRKRTASLLDTLATVTPGLTAGKSIVSRLPAREDTIVNYASADGYKVTR
ncbi:hypothetical protein SAZ11_04400 [Streptomyces sp. FXJ1.4098]|uniref:hypothetical protein n=1 Tax=Streptomyces sp. NPDC020845 TaxID=3365096 RepID=UPI0029971810|nr:hypothetical protein [Streptomyces sp. FXJ1.4098]